MHPYLAGLIRTFVPIAVGQIVAWLALVNVVLPADAQGLLSTSLGGLLSVIYYAVTRALEERWPAVGVLLGLAQTPDSYSTGKPPAAQDEEAPVDEADFYTPDEAPATE